MSPSTDHREATFDLCVIGDGPVAAVLALSAQELGLSVLLLHDDEATAPPGPRIGLVGHRHPYGYHWLVRRHGGRPARRFAALTSAGRDRVERLMSTYAIPGHLGSVACYLGDLARHPRSLRRELDAMAVAGLPVDAAARCVGAAPLASARYRLRDEIMIDEEAFGRGAVAAAQQRGVIVDRSRVRSVQRVSGLSRSWALATDDGAYAGRHVAQTDRSAHHASGPRGRSVGTNTLLIDTGDVVPQGRYRLHGRQPVDVVVREAPCLGYRQLVVSRYGGRTDVDTGLKRGWLAPGPTDSSVIGGGTRCRSDGGSPPTGSSADPATGSSGVWSRGGSPCRSR